MKIDGPTIALILSILGLMATLFLTKLGNDVRKNRIKNQRLSYKEKISLAVKKRWQADMEG
ncbi:hypothetical protein [Sulfurospirillum multivorans]|uniref:Uncharacterized protein n=2 Tax=Sulfurospirillum multivorans TaxID=66821 RepID=A0AA86AJ96_SULMK|nr:hypothetical protein [Sulfurospirillum multivorans]AHJ11706.1 hypothetical protein SMUL_0425 [Sulfurospirillum multivorans DSM 12446]QEH05212.1 hypothetical protein SMN_0424 [Sulfurospirillum multivorans]